MKKFYITTPIYYVNDRPHIGHAYTTTVADALARYYRLRGGEVMFSVGVDENSQKNVQAMEKAGETDLQVYLDKMAETWKETWKDLGIYFDDFIRTTEQRHIKGVKRFWEAVVKSGDIYEGSYEGKYCVGCEAFKVESDLQSDRCPLHPNKELEVIREKNYFFRASRYRDALLDYIDQHPEFVQPETRRNEVRNYIKDHFTDFSVSREAKNLQVGIPVPGDETQRIYVWFDALLNYVTLVGYGNSDERFSQWWPCDLHLVGKDIIKFHCALWPAMIMSAAKNDPLLCDKAGAALLPRRVFAHGFFTVDGQKISKSLGNAIDPREPVARYGFDPLRYYMLRDIPFGEDGDFSYARLEERYVHDLANTLGNLVNRSVAMSRKYFDGKVPTPSSHDLRWTFAGNEGMEVLRQEVDRHVQGLRFDFALEAIWNGIDGQFGLIQANKFIEDTQPFKLIKTDPDAVATILFSLLEYCRHVADLIEPMLPETSKKMKEQLGEGAGSVLPEPQILFPPIV